MDLAFWFTFAGYNLPHRSESRRDLDMISYGVVTMLEAGPPAGYQDLGWAPRLGIRRAGQSVKPVRSRNARSRRL